MIVYKSTTKFTKFFLRDLFSNKLKECSEKDFDEIVVKFRNMYDLVYADNGKTQLFYCDGVLEAKRCRSPQNI